MTEQQQPDRYTFSWDDLGDFVSGRPNLGVMTNIVCYRLLQYTFKEVLSQSFGREKTKELFVRAGHLAGMHFCRNMLTPTLDFDAFVAELRDALEDLKMGILRIESADKETMRFTLTMSEDLDCSGLPLYGETVCDYDEGFIAGILEIYTGIPFHVEEVDCWATGDRTCRFEIQPRTPVPAL